MKWIRGSMNKIDLVEGEKKIAYIVYQNYRWTLYEGVKSGVVKMSEMIDLTEEYAGIKLVQEDGQGHCSVFAEKVGE